MKFFLIFALCAPFSAWAAAPTSLSQIPLDHLKDPSGVKLTSVGDRTLIAVQPPASDDKGAFWYGVDPGMDAQTARVVWTSRVACPLTTGTGDVQATPTWVLCRTDHDVFALSPADGSVRWRFHHKDRITAMGFADQRVAVNVDNAELTSLDLKSGRVLRRFDLRGAPLQAVVQSPQGPLALVVAKFDDQAPTGFSHRIYAQPLAEAASTAAAPVEPLSPAWSAPFGGADYRLVPSQNAIVTTPASGVIDARDTATGKVLWAEPTPLLPTLEPLADGLAVGGIRPDGIRWIGLANTRTRITTWRRAWPFAALQGVGLDNGHVVWLGEGGWLVTRAQDGQQEAAGELTDDAEVASVQAADHVMTLLLWRRKTGGTWQQVALHPIEPPKALAELESQDWLVPGRQLNFLHFRHEGRDPQTLLPGDGAMLALTVWPKAAASGWAFDFRLTDAKGAGQNGARSTSKDEMDNATALDLDLVPGPTAPADHTALQVSRALWQKLTQTGEMTLKLDGEQVTLRGAGPASVRLQVRDKPGPFHWADVDVQVASTADGSIRLWWMPFGESAIAARAELAHRTWALMSVDWRPPEETTAVKDAKGKLPSGKKGKKSRKK